MKKVTVLGAGMVGSAIAQDLAADYDTHVVDADQKKLTPLTKKAKIKTTCLNIKNKGPLREMIFDSDLVIGAVPGFMGFEVLKSVVEAGKNVVDISFFEEDALLLDKLAKEKGITVITDCGVSPGMNNIILGYYNKIMKVREFITYVGGLPFQRKFPFQYKAPFSPTDVIEIYTRPARLVENGNIVVKPAMSDTEFIEVNEVGTLEAFNTDGLRSLLHTMKIPFMKEKTLRYPGHIEYIKVLKESGFFSEMPVTVEGHQVKPIDLSTRLLFPLWKLNEDDKEFTAMRIIIKSEQDGSLKEYVYDLFDTTDAASGISSMARTTGYTCTAAARLVLENKFSRVGICPPEFLGEDKECFDFILSELEKRGVVYRLKEKVLN